MARENYGKALAVILKFEGGKDDDPRDPGGRTNQGVIQRVYTAYRKSKGLANRDVFLMENPERDEIYRTQYADKVQFDKLPPGVDLIYFDGAVNAGPTQCTKWFQRALGLNADGVLGTVTLQRIIDFYDHDVLCAKVIERRNAFYRALKTFKTFGKGWLSRTSQVIKVAQAWAMGSIGPVVTWVANMNKKAAPEDFLKLPSTTVPAALSGTGGASTALSTIQQAVAPMSDTTFGTHVMTGVAIASAVLLAAGLAWTYWAKYRRDQLTDVLDLVVTNGANDNADIPAEVVTQYEDPNARGAETGNIAPGNVTTSGRSTGDTEVRVNTPRPVPPEKQDAA